MTHAKTLRRQDEKMNENVIGKEVVNAVVHVHRALEENLGVSASWREKRMRVR